MQKLLATLYPCRKVVAASAASEYGKQRKRKVSLNESGPNSSRGFLSALGQKPIFPCGSDAKMGIAHSSASLRTEHCKEAKQESFPNR